MSEGKSQTQINWWGLLLLPLAIPVALLAGLFAKPARRTPEEVANYLRNFIEGGGADTDWDDFESVPIADPNLEAVRREAAEAPLGDLAKLRDLLTRVEAMIAANAARQ